MVGTHFSKSIRNPVLKIVYRNTTLVFRYNFYDYEIAVINDNPLYLLIKGLFYSQDESFFFQGIPDEYQLSGRYETDHQKFMAKLRDRYQFYTFMFLIKAEIDRMK